MASSNLPESTCAVSVIIPMYNAEKYIGECLDSLLDQTFQNFEVILVNDCSTDSSRQVAESYLEKFGEHLKIFDNEKNLGAGATRNNGMLRAGGEYIFFMDADDLILADGLERMYKIAKYFDVDVVNCTGFYEVSDDGKERILRRLKRPTETFENIFEMNLEWRIKGLLAKNFYWASWRKLLRRDLLLENEVFFPVRFTRGEDVIWTHGVFFFAKKIIHVPLAVYLYRQSFNSLLRTKHTDLQKINLNINAIVQGLKWLEDVMSRVKFFDKKPFYRYAVLKNIAQRYIPKISKDIPKVSQPDLYSSLKQEFGKDFGGYDILLPVLFSIMSNYWKNIEESKKKITELENNLKQGEQQGEQQGENS